MQILRPHYRPAESEPGCGAPEHVFHQALQMILTHVRIWEPLLKRVKIVLVPKSIHAICTCYCN